MDYLGYSIHAIKPSANLLYLYMWDGDRDYRILVLDTLLKVVKDIQLDQSLTLIQVSTDDTILFYRGNDVFFTNDFFETTIKLDSNPSKTGIIRNNYYYNIDIEDRSLYAIQLDDPLNRIHIIDYFTRAYFVSEPYQESPFIVMDDCAVRIDELMISEITQNLTSTPIRKFMLTQNGDILTHTRKSVFIYNENDWDAFMKNDSVRSYYFDYDMDSDLFLFSTKNKWTNEFKSYISTYELKDFQNITHNEPIIIVGSDTLLSPILSCESDHPDRTSSLYSTDLGSSWSSISQHRTCFANMDHKERITIDDNLYFFGQTYSYFVGLGGNLRPNRYLDKISLNDFSGQEYELSSNISYANNSYALLTKDGTIYINAFQCGHRVENGCASNIDFRNELDQIEYPNYISNDFGETFTMVGNSPSGKLFEGPNNKGVLLVNNDGDDSRLYYRESIEEDYQQVILEPSNIGRIKYIRHSSDNYTYIATKHGTFYKTKDLFDFTLNSETEQISDLDINPNPAQDLLHLNLDLNKAKYEIYSITGMKVACEQYNDSSIDVSKLEQGLYIITLIDYQDNEYVDKFIKQ